MISYRLVAVVDDNSSAVMRFRPPSMVPDVVAHPPSANASPSHSDRTAPPEGPGPVLALYGATLSLQATIRSNTGGCRRPTGFYAIYDRDGNPRASHARHNPVTLPHLKLRLLSASGRGGSSLLPVE
jgi:hypothetical protein